MKKFKEYLKEATNDKHPGYGQFFRDKLTKAYAEGEAFSNKHPDGELEDCPYRHSGFIRSTWLAGFLNAAQDRGDLGWAIRGLRHPQRFIDKLMVDLDKIKDMEENNAQSFMAKGGNFSDKNSRELPRFFNLDLQVALTTMAHPLKKKPH